jgi:hypothetical protein
VAKIRHPRRASVTVVRRPKPLDAPVIRATLFVIKPPENRCRVWRKRRSDRFILPMNFEPSSS